VVAKGSAYREWPWCACREDTHMGIHRTRRMVRCFACAVALAAACACGGKSGRSDAPEPIPECQQYEQLIGKCMGTHFPLAQASAPVGKSHEEIAQMKKLCTINLQRLKEACR
jgi:hypothetical protein